jgi:hypothetical protein
MSADEPKYDDFEAQTQWVLNFIASTDPDGALRAGDQIRASRGRGWVRDHVATNYEGALQVARQIPDPWFRCQALSYVAEHTADASAQRALLAEAFGAAVETAEPNRVVSVSVWPLEVLCSIGSADEVAAEVARLLAVSATEPHSLRRCDAQARMLHALRHGPMECFWAILDECTRSCTQRLGWRRDRILRGVARLVNEHSHQKAVEVAQLIDSPRFRRQALQWIEEPEERPPDP